MGTQVIVLQDHQRVAPVGAILKTRPAGKAPSEDEAVKLAKRVADLGYAVAKPT